MSRKIKLIAQTSAALLVLSSFAASVANAELAPRWKVAGAFLGNSVTKHYTGTLTGTAKIVVPGLLTLGSSSCTITGTIVGSAAKVAGTHKESVLKCHEVKVTGAPACEVHTIESNPLDGELGWMANTDESNVITFTPEEGGNDVFINITECALEGEYPVTGGLIGTLEPPAQEVAEATLRFGAPDTTTTEHYFTGKTPTADNRDTMKSPSLVFAGREATFTATFDIKLVPQENFGVFAG